MNGEIAQICDITIAAKSALKAKNKINYIPSKYENKIEFLFTENFKAKDVNEWYEHCIEKGLEDIKDYFGISKKAFKRAIGSLLKNGLIEKNGDYFILKK